MIEFINTLTTHTGCGKYITSTSLQIISPSPQIEEIGQDRLMKLDNKVLNQMIDTFDKMEVQHKEVRCCGLLNFSSEVFWINLHLENACYENIAIGRSLEDP